MKRNRTVLKDYFNRGDIPTEENFADLIDSMLIQDEDNIAKSANDPLKITASGAEEVLINFYKIEGGEKLSWLVKQKPNGKTGLSISDPTASRLFIESDTGKVGIGTTAPTSALHLDIPASSNLIRALTVDVQSFGNSANAVASHFLQVRDIGAAPPAGKTHFYIRGDGNVGIGTTTPNRSLTIENTAGANYLNVKDGTHEILMGVDNNGGIVSVMTNHDLIFRTGNADRMRINAAGNVSITGRILQENWIEIGATGAPGFQDGWTNYANSYNTAGYYKDSLGIVRLKGLVKSGTIGFDKTIFTLPAGYRPAGRELQVVCTDVPGTGGGAGRVDILPDGRVIPGQGSASWYSLDGVTFRAGTGNIVVGPIVTNPTGPIVTNPTGPIGPVVRP